MRAARWSLLVLVGAAGLFVSGAASALNVERLTDDEQALLQSTMRGLDPLIRAKKQDGAANVLTWEELLQPLDDGQRAFISAFRALRADTLGATSHYFGEPDHPPEVAPVGPQQVTANGQPKTLDPQFLPRPAHNAYLRLMQAMERDLGKRLLVESGYRSPAYQLYLFLFYLPKHGFSIRDTNRFVALPGHSEHGAPQRQAIDFINQAGINGEDHPEEFEALPEYRWLQEHAGQFGFALSYPRDNPYHTSFEPWHWHHDAQ